MLRDHLELTQANPWWPSYQRLMISSDAMKILVKYYICDRWFLLKITVFFSVYLTKKEFISKFTLVVMEKKREKESEREKLIKPQ